jgi:hypothetical protein
MFSSIFKAANQAVIQENNDMEKYVRLMTKIDHLPEANEQQYPKLHSSENPRSTEYTTLCLKKNSIFSIKYQAIIKKIVLISNFSPTDHEEDIKYVLEIATIDNEKKLLYVENSQEYYSLLEDILDLNGRYEAAFLDNNIKKLPEWKSNSVQYIYQEHGVQYFYDQLYMDISTILKKKFLNSPKSIIKIFSFGCGDGSDVKNITENLNTVGINCRAIGFDFNPDNISLANYKKTNFTFFVEGNTLELLNLFNKYNNHDLFNDISCIKKNIFLFSGSVTRNVLDGTQNGLSVLQQSKRCADFACFAGVDQILITFRMAKRCGWKMKTEIANNTKREIFVLEKMTSEERKTWLFKQFNPHEGLLDLSMSSNPVEDLELLMNFDFNKVKKINLSYCYILPNEIKILELFLKPFKDIIVYYNDKSSPLAFLKLPNLQLLDIKDPNEVTEFSNNFISRYKIS